MLADKFACGSDSRESLQKLIDVVYRYIYRNRWRLNEILTLRHNAHHATTPQKHRPRFNSI